MELPQSLWNQKLSNGIPLGEFVEQTEPKARPISDITAFTNVWQQRLADASACDLPDYKHKAQKILKFLTDHDTVIVLLLWPRHKLGALFEPNSCDFLLLD